MSRQCAFILNTTLKNGMDLDTTKKWVEQGVHYLVDTSKNIFVFLHGFGGSPYDVYPLANRLLELNETCLASVIIGQAQMKWDEPLVTADAIISHSGALLNQGLQLKSNGKRLVVVGFSMGGALSIIHANPFNRALKSLLAPYLELKQGQWLFYIWRPLSKKSLSFQSYPKAASLERVPKSTNLVLDGCRWAFQSFNDSRHGPSPAKIIPSLVPCPTRPSCIMNCLVEDPVHAKQVKCHRSQHVLLFDHD